MMAKKINSAQPGKLLNTVQTKLFDHWQSKGTIPGSLYNYYKSFISYRNTSKVLTYGGIETSPLSIRELVSLIRVYEGEQRLAIHNVSDVEITAKLESVNEFTTIDYTSHEGARLEGTVLVIPAYASVIMKVITNRL
jgi:glycosidase